jgi:probable phosphomutase (TIGR03848 family)
MKKPKPAPPASTLMLLVRHGRTPTTGKVLPGRAPGLHLSEEGQSEARAVAERLSAVKKIDVIYASPLERAKETATPLAKQLGQKVVTHKGLLECEFGDWTGRLLADLYKLPEWSAVQRYPSGFRFPNGESFSEMQARFVSTLGDIRAKHVGATIAIFSHADPIKAAVADAMGTHLDLFQRITISTCSVTAIAYGSNGPSVLTVNDTGSLGTLRPS